MAAANGAKGNPAAKRMMNQSAKWETDLLKNLREEGFEVERLRLAGREDEGDLVVLAPLPSGRRLILEAKAGALHPAQFVEEAITGARHYEEHRGLGEGRAQGIVVAKQRGKSWREAYVLTTLSEFLELDGKR